MKLPRAVMLDVGAAGFVTVMSVSSCLAEAPKLSLEEADDACARYEGAYISHTETEKEIRSDVPVWKFKCEHHPNRRVCEDALDTVGMVRGDSPPLLICGQPAQLIEAPPKPPSHPKPPVNIGRNPELDIIGRRNPELDIADDACAKVAGAYISNTETEVEVRQLVPVWRGKCAHHPYKPTCEDTVDTIHMVRHIIPFICVPERSVK